MMLLRVGSWWVIEVRQVVIRAGPREGSSMRALWNLDMVISVISIILGILEARFRWIEREE